MPLASASTAGAEKTPPAWIKPVRKNLIMGGGVALGSKYKTIMRHQDFCLQERKEKAEQGHRSKFRIITSGDKDYFELAYSGERPDVEWTYLTSNMLKVMPKHIITNEKLRLQWIVARCQQLWLEAQLADGKLYKEAMEMDQPQARAFSSSELQMQAPRISTAGSGLRQRKDHNTGLLSAPGSLHEEQKESDDDEQPASSDESTDLNGYSPESLPQQHLNVPENELTFHDSDPYDSGSDRGEPRMSSFDELPPPQAPPTKAISRPVSSPPKFRKVIMEFRGLKAYVCSFLLLNMWMWMLHECGDAVFRFTVISLNVVVLLVVMFESPLAMQLVAKTKKAPACGDQALPLRHSETTRCQVTPADTKQTKRPEILLPRCLEPVLIRDVESGSTLVEAEGNSPQTWRTIPASLFEIRSHGYLSTKEKEPSREALYRVITIDIFKSDKKPSMVGKRLPLPSLPIIAEDYMEEKKTEGGLFINGVPTLVLLVWTIPSYETALWTGARDDGEGNIMIITLAMTRATRAMLENIDNASAGVRLLKKFCEGIDGREINGKLKCLARLLNAEELDIGMITKKTVNNYNGKPFMTGPRCHTCEMGDGYLEIDCDIHRYSKPFKMGIYSVFDQIRFMKCEVAMVIQGENDDELPEQVLACFGVNCANPDEARRLIL